MTTRRRVVEAPGRRCLSADVLRLVVVSMVSSTALTGCQLLFEGKDPSTTPHPQLERLWKDYQKLPDKRALAIAGDPKRRWVAGASAGHATQEAARQAALEECGKRRYRQNMREVCRIYADGGVIVWEGP